VRCPASVRKNTTLLSSMSVEGMGLSVAVEGASTAALFDAYVEKVLTPTLRPEHIMIMDNLLAHNGASVGTRRR
jgi:hypothetical protein